MEHNGDPKINPVVYGQLIFKKEQEQLSGERIVNSIILKMDHRTKSKT